MLAEKIQVCEDAVGCTTWDLLHWKGVLFNTDVPGSTMKESKRWVSAVQNATTVQHQGCKNTKLDADILCGQALLWENTKPSGDILSGHGPLLCQNTKPNADIPQV